MGCCLTVEDYLRSLKVCFSDYYSEVVAFNSAINIILLKVLRF